MILCIKSPRRGVNAAAKLRGNFVLRQVGLGKRFERDRTQVWVGEPRASDVVLRRERDPKPIGRGGTMQVRLHLLVPSVERGRAGSSSRW